MAILKGQMIYLEEWSLLDREHSSSLLGSTEALKASIIRLPIVGGARADMQDVKDAVGSAVDVMQAMGASIYSLLSKVEKASSLVSELAKDSELELALLVQSRELLSTVAALHPARPASPSRTHRRPKPILAQNVRITNTISTRFLTRGRTGYYQPCRGHLLSGSGSHEDIFLLSFLSVLSSSEDTVLRPPARPL
ncbi:hypothetical protein HPP92_007533 [Vanilla planifolia]|uniref:Uncharacterized protein n=1 Tax=Vanilla planifolia TaxID=51239 RepID=A0A835RAT4_VANPL|nr:hypothetical protein HPP92_007757 [Vanilla planifolia]KAG0490670.1 hypothetical protein HPP92_007533 [Vanilla planifolia]